MITEQRVYQAYYTSSEPIVNYMLGLLRLTGTERVFEPCAGDGVFLDPILAEHRGINIDAYELNELAATKLESKYADYGNVTVRQTDTLTDIDLELSCSMGGKYDAIIANPPYGAWRDQQERTQLKKRFNGFYAKESYSLFLYRCIQALKVGGRLVFIIPDTYLNLNMHKDIRKFILTRTRIKEVSLFPSSFFPGVNFGYANLSIIALEKCGIRSDCEENQFNIWKGFNSVSELGDRSLSHLKMLEFQQKQVLSNNAHIFLTNDNHDVSDCIRNASLTIGDVCDCATGFYSGNDKERLRVISKDIRNSNRYQVVNNIEVAWDESSRSLDGLSGERKYVPIVKGGNTRYCKPNHWFMEWSKERVQFYKNDSKARFQNSSYYFKQGIAVPMVSSSSITGALIEYRLFDQSIVGVFPKEEYLLYYLLAFFNSPTCTALIRTINPSTNNSSNYIKKIPFIEPNSEFVDRITDNTKQIYEQMKSSGAFDENLEYANNELIKGIYGF
jgi:hypothetical protein